MGKYKAQWRYASGYGSFNEGDVVEFPDELAEAINRDSPGVLRASKGPKADRMVKGPKATRKKATRKKATRKKVGVPPEGEGVMTRENFAAVKDKA